MYIELDFWKEIVKKIMVRISKYIGLTMSTYSKLLHN